MSFARTLTILALLFLGACATVPKAPLVFTPGAVANTLSAAVSLSVSSSGRNVSGNGFMVYRRPDQLHLVLLSPFGTTMLEAFAQGERITLIYPSQGVAFSGRYDELPDDSGMQGWRMMRWVMDADPSAQGGQSGTIERPAGQGVVERVTYESGLITEKSNSAGERVFYRNYELANGVPYASELEMLNAKGDRVRLRLEDAEINTALDGAAFTPRLEGLKLLPLSAMQRP